jgi:hypothetical protein
MLAGVLISNHVFLGDSIVNATIQLAKAKGLALICFFPIKLSRSGTLRRVGSLSALGHIFSKRIDDFTPRC